MTDAPPPPPPPRRAAWWRGLSLRRVGRLPLSMMLTSLLAALGIVQLSFQLGNTVYRSVTWSAQTRATDASIRQLERDVKILQDARRAADTPEYLRELARCQGFVGENETVVVSPEAPDNPGENCRPLRLP